MIETPQTSTMSELLILGDFRLMNHKLKCHHCHGQAVIEIGPGCKCTACDQTWGSMHTFIRERFYLQSRSDELAQVVPASSSHSNPDSLSEQWAKAIAKLPVKFSTILLKLVTKLIIRLIKLFITMTVNLAILVFVTYPILIFAPLFLKIRDRNIFHNIKTAESNPQ